jgi:hypothetical protein
MKYRVYRCLDLVALRNLIPKRFHPQLKRPEYAAHKAAAIVFDQRDKSVIPAETIRQVLESVGSFQESLKLVVAKNLTREGAQLLTMAGFRLLIAAKANAGAGPTLFRERVRYSRPGAYPGWHIKDWETADKLLGFLDPDEKNFAIFDLPDGSYIQCLGSKTALTVEARVYDSEKRFRHWVFGKGNPSGRNVTVGGIAGQVTVDSTQSLKMRDARLIIRQFLTSRGFSQGYFAQEVTERFL